MFVVGCVTRALYASSVFCVWSLAFATAATVLSPALTKRSVSLSPWVRLRSAFCAAATGNARSRAVNTNGAVRAIDVRMFSPLSDNGVRSGQRLRGHARRPQVGL